MLSRNLKNVSPNVREFHKKCFSSKKNYQICLWGRQFFKRQNITAGMKFRDRSVANLRRLINCWFWRYMNNSQNSSYSYSTLKMLQIPEKRLLWCPLFRLKLKLSLLLILHLKNVNKFSGKFTAEDVILNGWSNRRCNILSRFRKDINFSVYWAIFFKSNEKGVVI